MFNIEKINPLYRTLIIAGMLCISVFCAFLLYGSFGIDSPLLNSLAIISLLVSPLFLIHISFAEHALVAVILLTLPLNVDQQLFLNENHLGGAQGWVLSLNGLALLYLYLLLIFRKLQGEDIQYSLVPKVAGVPLLALILFSALSITVGTDRLLGVFELLEIIKMYLIFVYLYYFIIRTGNTSFILAFVLGGLFFESLIAMGQKATGSNLGLELLGASRRKVVHQTIGADAVYRVGGTLGNGNSLAWYLDFILPIPLALIFIRAKKWITLSSWICLISGGLVLLFTFSRGGGGFHSSSVQWWLFCSSSPNSPFRKN